MSALLLIAVAVVIVALDVVDDDHEVSPPVSVSLLPTGAFADGRPRGRYHGPNLA